MVETTNKVMIKVRGFSLWCG